jgi:hypothetical protein
MFDINGDKQKNKYRDLIKYCDLVNQNGDANEITKFEKKYLSTHLNQMDENDEVIDKLLQLEGTYYDVAVRIIANHFECKNKLLSKVLKKQPAQENAIKKLSSWVQYADEEIDKKLLIHFLDTLYPIGNDSVKVNLLMAVIDKADKEPSEEWLRILFKYKDEYHKYLDEMILGSKKRAQNYVNKWITG